MEQQKTKSLVLTSNLKDLMDQQKENTEIIPAIHMDDIVKAQLNCFTRISLMIKKYINCICESSCNKK